MATCGVHLPVTRAIIWGDKKSEGHIEVVFVPLLLLHVLHACCVRMFVCSRTEGSFCLVQDLCSTYVLWCVKNE